MIHIEILSSSDPLALGLYEFEFDKINIGRSKKNDIIFQDKELPLQYILLHIVEEKSIDQLIIRSFTRAPFFFVNGKKISGLFKIYENDTIAFGENKIKIIKFKRTKIQEDLSEDFRKFEQNSPDLQFALDFIEEVLVDMENKATNV
jgi:hypothetical protein